MRALPSVTALLATSALVKAADILPHAALTAALRAVLQTEREALLRDPGHPLPDRETLAERAAAKAAKSEAPTLGYALNATGVVLHTGLGRARLAREAQEAVARVASGHSPVEIDAESGRRGSRQTHVRSLLCALTGAEDALVVNNCAAAVLLAVSTLAAGREVIISRGELVEIGGAFRMPDIIRASGARLVEVGTTNRTRVSDYSAAITADTALILRCHPSNFAIVGFTESAPLSELAALGRQAGIPVMDDQGAGLLIPPERLGIPATETLPQSIAMGCSIVTASGDKLLGGPQAGIVLGSREFVSQLAKHPLARAVRIDKLTLAALEATLRLYRDPAVAIRQIPTLRYLTRTEADLKSMARRLLARVRAAVTRDDSPVSSATPSSTTEVVARKDTKSAFADSPKAQAAARPAPGRYSFAQGRTGGSIELAVVADHSEVGGGSLPGMALPTWCLSVRPAKDAVSVEALAQRMRLGSPPLFTRIRDGAILIDPRTLEDHELPLVAEVVRKALQQ